ncbi:MAG TPA: type II toxin-antitoxin system HipA family toxin [Candidatus Angelobacter sp.]|nr:type II toxin-antitoxin system HipA family toxin [Candidatus Angelobacter sp.]
MTDRLIALLGGAEMGQVLRDRSGRLSFHYNKDWQGSPDAYPLSLSMPLALSEHGHSKIDAFLWGLLPDNEAVIEAWANRYQVSPRSSFGLIAHVGEDCAGAVQFVRPEQLPKVRTENRAQDITWLTEAQVAERLGNLRGDHAAWRSPRDTGQFSLAGAQPKTALILENGKWGIPSGRIPTTHILKPPTGEWDGHSENEHFCLEVARTLGLTVPNTGVKHFGEETAIVIERYDRTRLEGNLLRLHQEDTCQALGLPPTKKYQNEGGPRVQDIADLLRNHSSRPEEDVWSFLDAVAFNWLIAGTDAHAKNYSILIGARGNVRFAPLYDVSSILPYKNVSIMKAKLAMKIGGIYRLRYIGGREWRKLAQEVRVDSDRLVLRMMGFAEALPDFASEIKRRLNSEGLSHPLIAKLADAIAARANQCHRTLR